VLADQYHQAARIIAVKVLDHRGQVLFGIVNQIIKVYRAIQTTYHTTSVRKIAIILLVYTLTFLFSASLP
jgi:hypothetical protein